MAKRVKISDLKTRISFFEYVPKEGMDPGEKEKKELFECWAKIDSVWMKDLERAKTNGTLEDLTITIRDSRKTYVPNNKHYLEIKSSEYYTKHYKVKSVQPDLQDKQFITIVAELVS